MRLTADIARVVHHRTQTSGGSTAGLYPNGGDDAPHFTVDENGIRQHFDTSVGSRGLVNTPGGVETNSLGAIQIEVVGFSGVTMPGATADNLTKLLHWIQPTHGIPWAWPNGRPTPAAPGPRDAGGHNRSVDGWRQPGHFGHSEVPENSHWDPAYTDEEWLALNQAMVPEATDVVLTAATGIPFKEYVNVNARQHIITMTLGADGKGWSLTPDTLVSPLFMVKEQGRYAAPGDPHTYDIDVAGWRAFVQNGHVEVVVDLGKPGATVTFEVLELVPS